MRPRPADFAERAEYGGDAVSPSARRFAVNSGIANIEKAAANADEGAAIFSENREKPLQEGFALRFFNFFDFFHFYPLTNQQKRAKIIKLH